MTNHPFDSLNTLVDLLRYRAADHPDRLAYTFLVDGERQEARLTYGELDQQARTIAARLTADGIAKGERALLLYPSGLEYMAAFFGCLYAEVVAVPAYPPRHKRTLPRIQAIAASAGPKAILSTASTRAAIEGFLMDAPELQSPLWLLTDSLDLSLAETWRMVPVDGAALAFLQYTSGSTATPKGVMVSHGNIMYNEQMVKYGMAHTSESSFVSWLPPYHDMGLIGNLLQPLYIGAPCIFMSPTDFLEEPFRWLAAISRYRAHTSGAPNFAYDLCVDKITPEQRETLDLSCWRVAYNGAEPVRHETIQRFAETFAPCGFRPEAFYPCYGLAEATLFVSGGLQTAKPKFHPLSAAALERDRVVTPDGESEDARTLAGCGQTWLDQKIAIVDPQTSTACPADRVGEIWISGPNVAQGYWNVPEETERTFRARLADTGEGPFLRTGDLGFIRGGELFITGRLKDLIIIRGHNHYPQDIELTVEKSHPALQPACGAVFAVEVENQERLVIAQEVKRAYLRKLDVDEVVSAIREAVSQAHELSIYAVLLLKPGAIPKTSSGKIQRHACREGFRNGELNVVAEWRMPIPPRAAPAESKRHVTVPIMESKTSIKEWLISQLAERLKIPPDEIDPNQNFNRYGLDSLDIVELIGKLEKVFGCKFPDTLFFDYPTIEHLVLYLAGVRHLSMERESASPVGAADEEIMFPLNAERLALMSLWFRAWQDQNLYFFENVIEAQDERSVVINGRRMLMLASYSYLGLLGHPKVNLAAQEAIQKFGTGVHGSRLLSGTTQLHKDFEKTIARFKKAEDAIVFSNGYATNLATISALMRKGDVVICDKLSHASIIDGCLFSGAKLVNYRHNDMEDLERCLQQTGNVGRLVITEAVFSMDGDIANLPEIVRLCKKYETYLMVDEAHSIGVLGQTGHGIEEHFGLDSNAIDIKMGTLTKTTASCGGYIAGKSDLIFALRHNARGYIFTGALPPPQVAAAKAAFELIEAEPERVSELHRKTRRYLDGVRALGFNTLNSETPIVPIVCKTDVQTYEMVSLCQAAGLFVLPVVFPAVPRESPRLRTTLTAAHTDEDIDFILDVLKDAGKQCGLID